MDQTLSAADVRNPEISALIASKMREFHVLHMPGDQKAQIWHKLRYLIVHIHTNNTFLYTIHTNNTKCLHRSDSLQIITLEFHETKFSSYIHIEPCKIT